MPPEASALVSENIEWSTPSSMVAKIQALYPTVTTGQVHSAWTSMSETLWKRDQMQLPSAKLLLKAYSNDVDVFDTPTVEGVEQLAWGMKKIMERLHGKVAEIGIDATCTYTLPHSLKEVSTDAGITYIVETNSKHLELYSIIGEYDNAGFPFSYCLLSTASSIAIGKRTTALEAWTKILREKYAIIPQFVHTDKDMAEIGMTRNIWPEAKIQLCWWHLRKAVRSRLETSKLSTSPYNIERARAEFPFISSAFLPHGQADLTDTEGGVPSEETMALSTGLAPGPNSLFIRVPNPLRAHSNPGSNSGAPLAEIANTLLPAGATNVESGGGAEKLTIRIPARSGPNTLAQAEEHDTSNGPHTFCPLELRCSVVDMMERHLCAHPLIPGYSAPTPEGIKAWAVKQMYEFCHEQDLPNLWAYLWENWYRSGRWELWSRASDPKIPRLKTTMIVEAQ